MRTFDNGGKQIGRLEVSTSNDKTVTVHELRNITTITVQDALAQMPRKSFIGGASG